MGKTGLSEAIRRMLRSRRRNSRWKLMVSLLACLVAACTVCSLMLPAVASDASQYQLENGALQEAENAQLFEQPDEQPPDGVLPDAEPAPEKSADASAGAASAASGSHELADFAVGLTLRDADGVTVQPYGTIRTGGTYALTAAFRKGGLSGQSGDFLPDETGFLTGQLLLPFACEPVSDGPVLDEAGVRVGSVWIDADGTLRLRLTDETDAEIRVTVRFVADTAQTVSISIGPCLLQLDMTEPEPEAAPGADPEPETMPAAAPAPEADPDPEVMPDADPDPETAPDAEQDLPADAPELTPADGLKPEGALGKQAEPTADRAEKDAGGTRDGTTYSSDLGDFVTQVVLTDANGNVIPPDGTVYIGEDYDITIFFSENNISGQEKQFQYNEDGYLTYQIPAAFECFPVTDGVLFAADGSEVGTYTIDANGQMLVQFVDGYIDASKVSAQITFHSTASASQEPGHHSVDFGDYIVEVNFSSAGSLSVEKTAGDYDPRTHSIEYEVRVEAQNGTVRDLVFTDTPVSQGLILDEDSFVYTSLDGQTVYSTPPTELAAGEGYIVRYRAYLDPSVYEGKNNVNYTARNRVSVDGTNDDGDVTAQDTAEKQINTYFLQKSGADEPANGRIRWTVTVGDGSTIVDGLVLRDVLGQGLTFDQDAQITVTPWTYTADGQLVAGTSFTIPYGQDPATITLPTGYDAYRYTLVYYTNYTLPEGTSAQQFRNTVTTTDEEHGPIATSGTTTGHAVGIPPTISKDVEKSADGTALHYTIAIDVPGSYAGNSGFYLTDTFTIFDFAGVRYYFGRDAENITVYTVNEAGEIRNYPRYTSDSPDYTFYSYPSSNPRVFYIGFNSSTLSRSVWLETEDVTLHIGFDLPLDAPVYTTSDNGTTYDLVEGMTVGDIVNTGKVVDNRIWLYYNDGVQYVYDNAQYEEIFEDALRKTAKINEDGIIEYEVIFNNRNPDGTTVLQRKMKELIFHDELLTEGMSYVDGSLYCDCYNANLSRIRTVYHYAPDISGSSVLDADAHDFLWYAGDSEPYTTLYEYAQHVTIGGGTTDSVSRLVFRYQVQVDKTSPAFQTSAQQIELQNRARLTGIMPNGAPYDSGPAECSVYYPNDYLSKEVEHAEGSDRAEFTITLNPAGFDLIDGASTMTVIDTMSANLQPVLRTIRILQKAGDAWQELPADYLYDPDANTLTFTLPDDVPLQITYTTLITETGEAVGVNNLVEISGFAEYSSVVDTTFQVYESGGAAHADSFRLTLLKQASDSHRPLPNAVFALYGPQNSERQGTPPAGTPETVTVEGQTLWYYTSYTTGADGTVDISANDAGLVLFSTQGLYALKEITAPEGYQRIDTLICFYAEERPEDGLQQVTILASDSPVVVANEPLKVVLPNTGGSGRKALYAAGMLLLAVGCVCLLLRRKKEEF